MELFYRSDASPSFEYFDRYRSGDDVTGREVLGNWRVSFHEEFSFGIYQLAAFAAAAFCYQNAAAVHS